jgi:hypothetical protein
MLNEKLLAEALALNNQKFLDEMPEVQKPHRFSNHFERRMKHYIRAQKKYSGKVWMERTLRYSSTAAAVILCFFTLNFVSAKVFDVSLWNLITGSDSGYTQLSFEQKETSTTKETIVAKNYRITEIPDDYQPVEDESTDSEWIHQIFVSDQGDSIVYLEGPITEELLVDIESGAKNQQMVGDKSVSYEIQDDSIVAYFIDDKYYHMLTIEGKNATIETVNQVIGALEEVHENEK